MRIRFAALATGAALAVAAPWVHAAPAKTTGGRVQARTGIQDGREGLAALQKGDFDEAIRLFTRALLPGRLDSDDAEFAYLNRGKAYAAKGDFSQASDDLSIALKMNPADAEAKAALAEVEKEKAEAAVNAALAPVPAGADPWGMYAAMAGHCFWYQAANGDPHGSYVRMAWIVPQKTLGFQVRTKTDQAAVGEYTLNAQTGAIIYSGLTGDEAVYSTVVVGKDMSATYGFRKNLPIRELIKPGGQNGFDIVFQTFADHAWRDTDTARLVTASADELISAGLIKPRKSCP